MAHLQTPPRQSSSIRAKTYGLITPSTPVHLSRYTKDPQQCPDAPFLPANFYPIPTILRTSPRTKHGDPVKPSSPHVRIRAVTDDRGTLIQPGMPPTPAETPIQKRRREQETRRRIEETSSTLTTTSTSRRLFPLKPVIEDAAVVSTDSAPAAPAFEIFTDSMHRTPISSPNNPFSFDKRQDVVAAPSRGLSPKKRKRTPAQQALGPHEMHYSFRGKRIVRKVLPGPNGESWRETIKPTRLFQKEIQEEEGRRLKRRRIEMRQVEEEMDTEEEEPSGSGEEWMDGS